jgi:hypothetical protein
MPLVNGRAGKKITPFYWNGVLAFSQLDRALEAMKDRFLDGSALLEMLDDDSLQ